VAVLARPDAAALRCALTAGKGLPHLVARWRLAACVCFAAGAAWALPGVVTDSPAHDKIIHVVMLGFTMLMIAGTAIAVAAQGALTGTVSCS
jgi:hypothetical protein